MANRSGSSGEETPRPAIAHYRERVVVVVVAVAGDARNLGESVTGSRLTTRSVIEHRSSRG